MWACPVSGSGGKHDDADMVEVQYSSSRNITFHGKDDLGITWGDWREMSRADRDETVNEWLYELVDVSVVDDES